MLERLNLYRRKLFSDNPKRKYIIGGVVIVIAAIWISVAYKTITINIDGKITEVATFKSTVEAALEENLIELEEKDKIYPELNAKISEKDVINITRARNILVNVDGQALNIKSAERSIEDMLYAEGIELGEMDKVEPALVNLIEEDLEIKITRVEEKVIKESESIEYETVVQKDENLDNSIKKVVQEGINGEKEITMKLILEDGQEVNRTVIEEKVLKEPVQEVIVQGTANTLVLSRGETIKYKKKLYMESTAYAGDGITATGTVPKRNPNGLSTIAVDPRVIPLGSKVYVEGYGYAIAEDTGGAIKSNIIDVFLNSNSECYSWGRKMVNVYIIGYPGEW